MTRRFDIAKIEFEAEDIDGRSKLVYAHYGLAIYFGQCLEETFTIMLKFDRIFRNQAMPKEELISIIESIDNSKKTMGNLIHEVKQNYNLPTSITDELQRLLDVRNNLVHSYFKVNIKKAFSTEGKLEMIKYFCDFLDDAKKLDEELKKYYWSFKDKLGLTDEEIERSYNEMIEKATNKEQ